MGTTAAVDAVDAASVSQDDAAMIEIERVL